MAAEKRKAAATGATNGVKKQKVVEHKPHKLIKKVQTNSGEEDDDFGGFPDDEPSHEAATQVKPSAMPSSHSKPGQPYSTASSGSKQFKLETSSAEAHAKQRELTKERKASRPNADAIQRSKRIWERLRRKSHVEKEERKELVTELFDIVNGRVRDFVFKHDSVRVVQCALKYANQEQRRSIARELKGDIKTLAESRYGKFLVAKMVQDGDAEVRNAVIPEFYGHIRRLINHPEASWIVDDIYRQIATQQQKAAMLREWYGAEFALFHRNPAAKVVAAVTYNDTADLNEILKKSPEKRKPILQYLLQLINSLIQKKMTGFTMLHDAMLQYFLTLTSESAEHTEFLQILKGDIDKDTEGGGGDLYKNLAFTKSGSRLVCLAVAYASPKDRKAILKVFKDTIETMAFDNYAKLVLVVILDVLDDTKASSKAVLYELLGQGIEDEAKRLDRLESMVINLNTRLPVLYAMAGMAKWLVGDADKTILDEVHQIRETTSKKQPETRRQELLEYMSPSLLEVVLQRAKNLVKSSFGCQFVAETLLECNGEPKDEAKKAVVSLCAGDPTADDHIAKIAAAGRMLKTLVEGGKFDPKSKTVHAVDPPLDFAEELHPVVKDHVVEWACSGSSFVIVGMLESEAVPQSIKDDVKVALKKGKKELQVAASGEGKISITKDGKEDGSATKKRRNEGGKGNAGAKLLLEKII